MCDGELVCEGELVLWRFRVVSDTPSLEASEITCEIWYG